MGFVNLREFVEAAVDDGRTWLSTFRKAVTATATVTGQWFDYSYVGGNPIPNYYAAAPLEASVLEAAKGIVVPRMATGETQWLHRWQVMTAAASATSTTNRNQQLALLDYLLFYPFVDMDAAGEDQPMVQTSALPRYSTGVGVQMMCVAQAPTVGGGRFTITYVDSDGGTRTTESLFCGAAQGAGAIVSASGAAAGLLPFVPLGIGVKGVREVTSVNFSVANGGLMAIVLVKPLVQQWLREESRRTTTGTLESFGDVAEWEAVRQGPLVQIQDGAFLGIIGQGSAGTLATSVLVGCLETVWS